MSGTGSLVCVGLGMMLGAHLTPRSRAAIESADVVFAAVSDPVVELWLARLHPDLRSLQPCYDDSETTPRTEAYRRMVALMLTEVRAGKRVCGAFYGHPGVFALAPHQAIAQARAEGFEAVMEPGISAEDCLFADLGIDPGRVGCQQFEASQFMFYQRRLDPSAYLLLWQIGFAGDRDNRRYRTGAEQRTVLVDLLRETYPSDHPVTIYEAATLPIQTFRADTLALADLPMADVHPHSTLVVPPAVALRPNPAILARLARLDAESEQPDAAHNREGVTHV